MNNPFIRHPHTAVVIAVAITLCGILALFHLPVAQYPNVTPVQISVSASYPGADARTMLETVVEPLERQINGVRDMLYLSSQSSDSGDAVVTVTFAVGTDGDTALQNVQDRVIQATSLLPRAVQREGVVVQEQSGNIILAVSLSSPNGGLDSLFLANYAGIHLIDRLKRIEGVGAVRMFGSSLYAMRIRLNAEKLAALSLTVNDIREAVEAQNTQISAGAVGSAPDPGAILKYQLRTGGRLPDARAFREIVVATRSDGAQVRLGDVAEVELGAETNETVSALDGKPTVMIVMFQRATANALEIADRTREILDAAQKEMPPDMAFAVQYDSTEFIRKSIGDVARTFALSALLVALVILVFLQNWRMALIPVLAIPVSIVGSFAVLKLLGYSINLVTLFALILAIGIVVDDAIIVIENIHRLMEKEQLSPADAAQKSMREITGAIVATTLVLLAMFVPITFLGGITGALYRQFGVTVSAAVLLSAANALSLTPALAALLLRPAGTKRRGLAFMRPFDAAFSWSARSYDSTLRRIFRTVALPLAVFLLICGIAAYGFVKLPGGFLPPEDQGVFFLNLQLPTTTALDQAQAKAELVGASLRRIPGVRSVVTIAGFDILSMTDSSGNVFGMAVLEPWGKRPPAEKLIAESYGVLMTGIPDALPMIFEPPPLPGIGAAGGFDFVIEEPGSTDPDALAAALERTLFEAMACRELRNVFSTFQASTPYLFLEIDYAKALRMGLSPEAIDRALENIPGFTFINDFNRFGRVYKVEMQGRADSRDTVRHLMELYAVGDSGAAVPLPSFARISFRTAPATLERYNLNLAAEIRGNNAPHYSSGQAMQAMENIARKTLPDTMRFAWTGLSYQEQLASGGAWAIFALALFFIYLFLAGLYENWLLPFPVLLAIPCALCGALINVAGFGISDNVYTQIGLVLLFGMACKTAILLVDFAKQRTESGSDAATAALEAANLRFRAILMTACAFFFGTLPLLFASGPGEGSQRSIGAVVTGGMLAGTVGVLFFVPVFYALFRRVVKKRIPTVMLGALTALVVFSACQYTPPSGGGLIEQRTIGDDKPSGDVKLIQSTDILTLNRCYEIAFANNPTYRSTEFAIRSARMRYYQALGAYSPSIAGGVAVGDQIYNGDSSDGSTTGTFYTFTTVQATWVLFDGLLREFTVIAAKVGIAKEEYLRADAARLLRKTIGTVFYEIISARLQQQIAADDAAFQEQQLEQARRRYAAGDVAKSVVLQFEARRNQALASGIRAGSRARLGLFSLALLLGYPEGTIPESMPMPMPETVENAPPPLMAGLNQALDSRSDLNALRQGLRQMKYAYYATYSAYSPTVSAFANYSYSSNSTQNTGNNPTGYGNFYLQGNSFNYGVVSSITLFNGFTRYNATRMMRAMLDQQYLTASGAWQNVVREVRGAYENWETAKELAQLARRTRDIQKEQRDLTAKEFAAGDVDIVRLDSAQTQFVNSEHTFLESETALRRARLDLDAAIGAADPAAH